MNIWENVALKKSNFNERKKKENHDTALNDLECSEEAG